jgi:hypothetical protein
MRSLILQQQDVIRDLHHQYNTVVAQLAATQRDNDELRRHCAEQQYKLTQLWHTVQTSSHSSQSHPQVVATTAPMPKLARSSPFDEPEHIDPMEFVTTEAHFHDVIAVHNDDNHPNGDEEQDDLTKRFQLLMEDQLETAWPDETSSGHIGSEGNDIVNKDASEDVLLPDTVVLQSTTSFAEDDMDIPMHQSVNKSSPVRAEQPTMDNRVLRWDDVNPLDEPPRIVLHSMREHPDTADTKVMHNGTAVSGQKDLDGDKASLGGTGRDAVVPALYPSSYSNSNDSDATSAPASSLGDHEVRLNLTDCVSQPLRRPSTGSNRSGDVDAFKDRLDKIQKKRLQKNRDASGPATVRFA